MFAMGVNRFIECITANRNWNRIAMECFSNQDLGYQHTGNQCAIHHYIWKLPRFQLAILASVDHKTISVINTRSLYQLRHLPWPQERIHRV
jgi:hypothetical protein